MSAGDGEAETPNHNMSQSREKLLLLISDGSDGYLTQTRQNLLFVSTSGNCWTNVSLIRN